MSDDTNEISTPGGRIAPRVARIISDAIIHTRQQLGKTQSDIAKEVFTDVTNHVSDEVRAAMGPLWRALANDPNVSADLKPLLHHLGHSRGQAWAWIGGMSASAALGAGLLDLLSNQLNPVIKPLIAARPNGVLSADVAARATATHVNAGMSVDDYVQEGRFNGIDPSRFKTLVELSRTWPAPGQLLDMVNREVVTPQVAQDILARQGYERGWAEALLKLAPSELTLPDIAAMWNRSIVDEQEAVRLGKRVGYNATQVRRALELGGEPLPIMDLSEAFRRGFIDRDRFNRGVVQGPLRNEWFDVLERLQFHRMLPEAAADAVNQGHMEESEGRRIAHEHGLDPEDFSVILQTAGQPPGLDFATEAYNRELLSDADWEVMFKESRIKNRYLPLMREMRTRLIPTETVRLMYRNGTYSRASALKTLRGHGFTEADANAQLDLEDVRKSEGTKDLTRAQILDLYSEDIIERSAVEAMLKTIGYDDTEVRWMVELEEINKVRRFVNLAIGKVRSAYVLQRIDTGEATGLLDQIGVSPTRRDALLGLWDLERETVSAQLTPAQIQAALKKGFLSPQHAYERLLGRGYAPEDAAILIKLTGKPSPVG